MADIDEDVFNEMKSELEHAHQVLTELGVGKESWSLAGRIDGLLFIVYNNWTRKDLRSVLIRRGIIYTGKIGE